MKNQLTDFSEKIGNRHIVCIESLTQDRIYDLVKACKANGIPYDFKKGKKNGNRLIYWVKNYSTEGSDDLYQVKFDSVCPLLDWWLFIYLPWDEFFSLVQGSHVFKEQKYYDEFVKEYDKPFKHRDDQKIEMNMSALFDNGRFAVIQ